MTACASCTSGLTIAMLRLDEAARNVADASAPRAPARADGAITGAAGEPSGSMDDPAAALLDLMTAELAFRANVEVMKTVSDMVRSLYEIVD
jgi:flagellar basal body rod protein FlgC